MREREYFDTHHGCGHRFGGGFEAGRAYIFEVRGEHRHHHHGHGRHGGRGERGFEGRRERLFDGGDLKLMILQLIAEEPSYGYQLIKTMEEKLAGGYAPSPGVIYPTLTLLEEEGLTSAAISETNKKVYTVTAEGLEYLAEHKRRIEEIQHRIAELSQDFERSRNPQLMEAFQNLRSAVRARITRRGAAPEMIQAIVDALNTAAKAIDEL